MSFHRLESVAHSFCIDSIISCVEKCLPRHFSISEKRSRCRISAPYARAAFSCGEQADQLRDSLEASCQVLSCSSSSCLSVPICVFSPSSRTVPQSFSRQRMLGICSIVGRWPGFLSSYEPLSRSLLLKMYVPDRAIADAAVILVLRSVLSRVVMGCWSCESCEIREAQGHSD
jgi:hypothetical protein